MTLVVVGVVEISGNIPLSDPFLGKKLLAKRREFPWRNEANNLTKECSFSL